MEQLDYNVLFRWFVGMSTNEEVCDDSSFTTNRDRLLEGDIARRFFASVMDQAMGNAEREAAREMAENIPGHGRATLGGDKAYDAARFIEDLRVLNVTPHVAQNTTGRRSAIDARTTRHPGYAMSIKARKLVEEVFGWMKTVATMRKTRFRGKDRVGWSFIFGLAAYNPVRMRNLGMGV